MIGIESSDSYLLEEYGEDCINLLDTITLVPTQYRTSANSRNFQNVFNKEESSNTIIKKQKMHFANQKVRNQLCSNK